jgi:hypothetical protein
VIAGLVHAGLSGLDEPEPKLWPETMSDDEAVPRLSTLAEALKLLAVDPVYELLRTYLEVKQSELDAVADLEEDEVCKRVCDVY